MEELDLDIEILDDVEDTEEKNKHYTFEEQMAIECMKKVKNPFKSIGVQSVMKDLNICRSVAYKLFKSEDFPSLKIGKSHQVSLIAYLLWKVKKGL